MALEILDRGSCKAMGFVSTAASATGLTLGVARIVSSGIAGRVKLVLDEAIGVHELVAHATCLPPAIGAGVTPQIAWVDQKTIEIVTLDPSGVLAAAEVRFSVCRILGVVAPPTSPALPNPLEILGEDLAVWLQGDLGTGFNPGADVDPWVNQVANGNAVLGPFGSPPQLLPNAFGVRPGVNFPVANAGLQLTYTTPLALGTRPMMWALFRANQLINTPGAYQPILAFGGGLDTVLLDASAPGAFGPTDEYDFFVNPPASSGIDTFLVADAADDLEVPHIMRSVLASTGTLAVDDLPPIDAPSAIPALAAPATTLLLNQEFLGGNPGFMTLGMVIVSRAIPTAPQIAAVDAWVRAYR